MFLNIDNLMCIDRFVQELVLRNINFELLRKNCSNLRRKQWLDIIFDDLRHDIET